MQPVGHSTQSAKSSSSKSEWRTGWPVVFCSMIGFGCSFGLFAMSAGLFIAPMRAEFGWTMSQAAFAPIVTLLVSLTMPVWGAIIDKFGARRIAIFGVFLFSTSYILLSVLPLSLLLLYAIAVCLGVLGAAGNSGPYIQVVATWFRDNTGSAFGVTMAGTSFSAMVIMPGLAIIVDRFGWRAGYIALAVILLTIALPLLLWLFRPNDTVETRRYSKPDTPSGNSLHSALKDIRFWLLTMAFSFAALPMGAFLTHLQPLLRTQGYSIAAAATFGGLFALAMGMGRVTAGFLIDRLWPYGVAAAFIAVGGIGCVSITLLTPQDPHWVLGAAVVAIGLSYGAEVDFAAYFGLKLFGLKSFSKVFGCFALILGAGVAAGGILVSALFDWTGGYALLGPITGGLFFLSSATMLYMGSRQMKRHG